MRGPLVGQEKCRRQFDPGCTGDQLSAGAREPPHKTTNRSQTYAAVAKFLEGGLPIVEQEPATVTWYAIKLGPSTFGIFDTFPDDAGRQAHLEGRVAAALMAQAPELLASAPSIEKVEILAAKLPG